MGAEGLDCTWCGSARSIEYGICQVCLMEYPLETQIIPLPQERVSLNRGVQDRMSLGRTAAPDRKKTLERKVVLDRKTAMTGRKAVVDRSVVIDPGSALDRKSARAPHGRIVDLAEEPTFEIAE